MPYGGNSFDNSFGENAANNATPEFEMSSDNDLPF